MNKPGLTVNYQSSSLRFEVSNMTFPITPHGWQSEKRPIFTQENQECVFGSG